ncbi:hypothetical protein [Paenibacillus pinihumi]|uniref:hypothetical protein n=1 Tax=Paenibacillus pinihumi TaxID=669462 RepID=UPI00041D9BB9|nr:hypothetical protein [Paenibacillus pinihumi]
MANEIVNKEQLHKLFLAGMPLKEIANQLNSKPGSIRTMIYHERQRNPHEWPHRIQYPGKPKEQPLMMHSYECTDCATRFAVEDYDDIDHSVTVCPICRSDQHLQDGSYGRFIATSVSRRAE